MILNNKQNKLQVVKYLDLNLDADFNSLEKYLLANHQGENIRLHDGQIDLLMQSFHILRLVCPEILFKYHQHNFVIFADHSQKFISDLKVYSLTDILQLDRGQLRNHSESVLINVDAILQKIISAEESLNSVNIVKEFILLLTEEIKATETTILEGQSSALFFILAQIMLYGVTGNLFYRTNSNTKLIKIF